MKALDFRRAKAQPDTVMNALGWKDTSQYDKRYGKRTATETMTEARALLDKTPQETGNPAKAIEQLAVLLAQGKIDLPTYQASILTLQQKPKEAKKGDRDDSLFYVH